MVSPAGSVLIIDDDRSFLTIVETALSRKGIESFTCSNADEALREASEPRYDIIVCDYFLPEIDGRSLLRKVLSMRRDCELILTSSYPIGMKWTYPDRIEFVDKPDLVRNLAGRLKRRLILRGQHEY